MVGQGGDAHDTGRTVVTGAAFPGEGRGVRVSPEADIGVCLRLESRQPMADAGSGEHMEQEHDSNLQVRLKNCLQTILELEPDLERLDLGDSLMKEFEVIKAFVENLGQVNVAESDVVRIEQATENFLEELRTPMTLMERESGQYKLMQ